MAWNGIGVYFAKFAKFAKILHKEEDTDTPQYLHNLERNEFSNKLNLE